MNATRAYAQIVAERLEDLTPELDALGRVPTEATRADEVRKPQSSVAPWSRAGRTRAAGNAATAAGDHDPPENRDALPPAVDLEFAGCVNRPDQAAFQQELTAFVDIVEKETGKPVLLYAMPSFTATYPLPAALVRGRWVRRIFGRPDASGGAIWHR